MAADLAPAATLGVEWRVSRAPVQYETAVAEMEARVAAIRAGEAPECVWLLEHPPLYTAGTSAADEELIQPGLLPVHRTGRGGRFTYHGPGQRVAYVMLDLARRRLDVRSLVCGLEDWMIATLAEFDVQGERREGRIGVWVCRPELVPGREDKIAAIGVRVRRWVSFHGVSLNVAPDLSQYAGIVPCGLHGFGVTSLADLGRPTEMEAVDEALRRAFDSTIAARCAQGTDTTSVPQNPLSRLRGRDGEGARPFAPSPADGPPPSLPRERERGSSER